MQILVAAATAKEISPFLDHLRKSKSQPVDVLITGVGIMAATNSLTRHFYINKPGLVIQAGIAGCFNHNIPLGTVVTVERDTIADLGVLEKKQWLSVFDLRLTSPNQFPYQKGWLINKNSLVDKLKIKKAKAITVNQVTTAKQMIRIYRGKFNPVLESMEGAVLHYCCLMENIPFLQIRAISNYAGERNKKKWKIPEAIANLNNELIGLINNL
jgi:futalosine hydrolase